MADTTLQFGGKWRAGAADFLEAFEGVDHGVGGKWRAIVEGYIILSG